MKNLRVIATTFAILLTSTLATAQKKIIRMNESTIEWTGKKVTGQHNGTVNFKEGALLFKGKKLTGGIFVVDMNSLTATDLSGEYQTKLNGHLKADDFFGTAKYPISTLKFKKITPKDTNNYTIIADLTIKGITKQVAFDLNIIGNNAGTIFTIDRTKYDIKYGSKSFFESIGDKAISDEFELKVNLRF